MEQWSVECTGCRWEDPPGPEMFDPFQKCLRATHRVSLAMAAGIQTLHNECYMCIIFVLDLDELWAAS